MKLEFLQLLSPSLPVGAFSYSEGLEWLVQNKKVHDEISLLNWLESELSRGQLRIEASSIVHIMKDLVDWRDKKDEQYMSLIEEWNSWLTSLRDSPELRSQQIQMGESLYSSSLILMTLFLIMKRNLYLQRIEACYTNQSISLRELVLQG